MDHALPAPTDIPAPGSYHWTPRLQREFLESIATTGSVKISAAKVGMSPAAAYQLRQRAEGAAFAIGWAAAVLIARGRLADELLDRAIWGQEETVEMLREDGRSFAKRRRTDARLSLAMLARLDRMAEARAEAGQAMLAQVVAGDWPAFLSLFDAAQAAMPAGTEDQPAPADETAAQPVPAPGLSAALALWLAARDGRANPLAALWTDSAIANEVARISAESETAPECEDTPERAPPSAEEEAAAMDVWYDEENAEWQTNFPPPADFDGLEEGLFGDPDYWRTLDSAEADAFAAQRAAEVEPLRIAGEAARRAYFARPAPANDPDARDQRAG